MSQQIEDAVAGAHARAVEMGVGSPDWQVLADSIITARYELDALIGAPPEDSPVALTDSTQKVSGLLEHAARLVDGLEDAEPGARAASLIRLSGLARTAHDLETPAA